MEIVRLLTSRFGVGNRINVRSEIKEKEMKETKTKINKIKSWFWGFPGGAVVKNLFSLLQVSCVRESKRLRKRKG